MHDYPEAKESGHICDLLDNVTVRLVRHEMYVANFYLNKNNFDAAVFRLQYALRNYVSDVKCVASKSHLPPGIPQRPQEEVKDTEFGLVPDALLLLGETYLKMRRYTDARSTFGALLARYPESGLVIPAKNSPRRHGKKGRLAMSVTTPSPSPALSAAQENDPRRPTKKIFAARCSSSSKATVIA